MMKPKVAIANWRAEVDQGDTLENVLNLFTRCWTTHYNLC